MKRIAFLVQLPKKVSPGQRFRFEQIEPILEQNNYQVDTFPFINDATYQIFYEKGFFFRKILALLQGFVKRFFFLFRSYKYDFIFLQREAAPAGPPVFEWLLVKIFGKKIIYDFDDAIWISDKDRGRLFSFIKCFWKIKFICKWSYKVSVGNEYLSNYAKKYNRNVIIIPTCVDTIDRYNIIKDHQIRDKAIIGWTGSHSTLKYLDAVLPILLLVEKQFIFDFVVICDRPPEFSFQSLKFIPWNPETEILDLMEFDIGIMPLLEDKWTEGKCGFKLIQYLSLGIPAVANPVGVNKKIIENGITGFLCQTEAEWESALKKLLADAELRKHMGLAGRRKIEKEYSIQSQKIKFLSLFS
jgi:glycosyltransferase involved in cell wall biosynthesis